MPGSRLASMDFPVPGLPITIKLCPPAAAISMARRASLWPRTSAMSGPSQTRPRRTPRALPGSGALLRRGAAPHPAHCGPGRRSVPRPRRSAAFGRQKQAPSRRSAPRPAHWQHAGHGAQRAVQPQLSQKRPLTAGGGQLALRGHDAHKHRQIVHRPGLAHVAGARLMVMRLAGHS